MIVVTKNKWQENLNGEATYDGTTLQENIENVLIAELHSKRQVYPSYLPLPRMLSDHGMYYAGAGRGDQLPAQNC